jgi:hypothetical protein
MEEIRSANEMDKRPSPLVERKRNVVGKPEPCRGAKREQRCVSIEFGPRGTVKQQFSLFDDREHSKEHEAACYAAPVVPTSHSHAEFGSSNNV